MTEKNYYHNIFEETFDRCYQMEIGECSQEKSYQLNDLEYLHYMLALV